MTGPCDAFRLDLTADFGICKCGFNKTEHDKRELSRALLGKETKTTSKLIDSEFPAASLTNNGEAYNETVTSNVRTISAEQKDYSLLVNTDKPIREPKKRGGFNEQDTISTDQNDEANADSLKGQKCSNKSGTRAKLENSLDSLSETDGAPHLSAADEQKKNNSCTSPSVYTIPKMTR